MYLGSLRKVLVTIACNRVLYARCACSGDNSRWILDLDGVGEWTKFSVRLPAVAMVMKSGDYLTTRVNQKLRMTTVRNFCMLLPELAEVRSCQVHGVTCET